MRAAALPRDPERLKAIRRSIAEMKPGPEFFARLLAEPEVLAVYKADTIERALEDNAKLPTDKRLPEDAVREHEEWCFSLIGV